VVLEVGTTAADAVLEVEATAADAVLEAEATADDPALATANRPAKIAAEKCIVEDVWCGEASGRIFKLKLL